MTTFSPNGAQVALDWTEANDLYLSLQVQRLRLRLNRRIAWLRSQWRHSPIRETAAQVISEPHADWLMQGENVEAMQAFYASDEAALDLSAAIRACEQQLITLVQSLGRHQPAFEVLAHTFRLSAFERDVLLLCVAPDRDASLRALYAYAQDDMTRQWPTGQLALSLADPGEQIALRPLLGETATLRRCQLIHVVPHSDDAAPPTSRPLAVDERLIDYINGINRPDERLALLLQPVEGGALTDDQARLMQQVVTTVRAEPANGWPLINLVGLPDSGQREIAAGVCGQLGIKLYRFDLAHLRGEQVSPVLLHIIERETLLLQIALLVELDEAAPLETGLKQFLVDLTRRSQVFVWISSREPVPGTRTPLIVRLPRPDAVSSLSLWQQTLGAQVNGAGGVLPLLVEQFDFGALAIRQVVTHAQQQAQLAGETLSPRHLWDASRDARASELELLAQRLIPSYTWDDLIVSPQVLGQLEEMAAQVAQRYTVYEDWGFNVHVSRGRGISALFSGPSGTGKTMAAEVLANHVSLALYRIDLASLFNKFVGETEKNIRQVFEAAERTGAVLFFDEADALFGKRTEVRDSHDRFANIEINYLLQRMESYWGVVILATNRRTALDRAFLRRLRFVIDFAFPDVDARRRLWLRAFPPETPLDALDYARLAQLEIAGGSIRSIALNGAFLAAADGSRVTMRHLMTAAHWEYLKIDKLETEAEFGEYLGRV
jgi:hypothetical protein